MSAADDLYEAAAARIRRLTPTETVEAVRRGALLIDLRPTEYRWREGEVSGAIPVPRHVFEWRLDPDSEYRLPELTSPDQEVVLMCSEGYSSALSADLAQRELGLRNVADLEGGFAAWKEAGLPWISHAPKQLRSS
jgi:rhodanese-related sulfurtransferase